MWEEELCKPSAADREAATAARAAALIGVQEFFGKLYTRAEGNDCSV